MSAIDKYIPHITITQESKNWFGFLRYIHKIQLFRQIFLSMVAIGLYTFGLIYYLIEVLDIPKISTTIHQILGITLGLLLVIRTNTAYDRFWEGRKAIGSLNNSCRNLALKLNAILPEGDRALRHEMAGYITAYAYALKEHLRSGVKFEELTDIEDPGVMFEIKKAFHVPNRIAKLIYERFRTLYKNHIIDGHQFQMLDNNLNEFTNVIGACERIKRTPQPKAYSMHLKLFLLVYVATLPVSLARELGYWCIPAIMIVFYAMVGMEMIGEEIEDPFGTDANDIPTDAICAAIRHNVFEILDPQVTGTKSS
jgi:ion channel-forming bestrophin family protein